MKRPAIPEDEAERLAALQRYKEFGQVNGFCKP